LIVCERTGQWAAALRRELADAGLRLWETRSLADAWDALAATPAAFLVLELLPGTAGPLWARMAWLAHDFPRARAAVLAPRRLAAHEDLAREAGAVYFACSPRRLAPLARMIVRHLASLPPPEQTLLERIWASLPWGGN
jgi:hypothetical protein